MSRQQAHDRLNTESGNTSTEITEAEQDQAVSTGSLGSVRGRHEHSTTHPIDRRTLLRTGAIGSAVGAAVWALPGAALAGTSPSSPVGVQVAKIYRLQATFHRAKTDQDLDLMMSLWASDATLDFQGDPNSPYTGAAAIREFFQHSGSFTHRRFSLVPSFKTQIAVHGDKAWLYFECHDIGDYDLATRFIASDTFLAGTLRNLCGNWVFAEMTAGSSSPLSADHYYFP